MNVPGEEPRFPVRPADRPDQRLDPGFFQALLEIEVSGRMADEWVNHFPLLLHPYRPTGDPFELR